MPLPNNLIHSSDRVGLERESLRVDHRGRLALSPHPPELGSSLTSPFITTDFSESQIEFTTGAHGKADAVLRELEQLQYFTQEILDRSGELLWPLSMPAELPAEGRIPIALYGPSEEGLRKHVYRQGLARRYGRRMQTVSGVHFNFSFGADFWLAAGDASLRTPSYFSMIRNFQRRAVYFLYLFGGSPAFDRSFLAQTAAHGEALTRPAAAKDERLGSIGSRTYFGEFATSLRQSEIGYTNSNQCELAISYDSLDDYVSTMCEAVSRPNPAFSRWSFEKGQQLNDHFLQIENEHYGVIRPKQNLRDGERPLTALERRGVAYLEVRCLDLDPFCAGGIDRDRMDFTHLVLLHCLEASSPALSRKDCSRQRDEHKKVAWFGRKPGLKIFDLSEQKIVSFREAGRRWLDGLEPLAERLDTQSGGNRYRSSLDAQRAKFADVELTPAARIIREMHEHRAGHIDYGLELAHRHARTLKDFGRRLSPAVRRKLENTASRSHERRLEIEARTAELPSAAAAPEVCGAGAAKP